MLHHLLISVLTNESCFFAIVLLNVIQFASENLEPKEYETALDEIALCGVSNFQKQAVSVVYRNLHYLNHLCGIDKMQWYLNHSNIKSNFVALKVLNKIFFFIYSMTVVLNEMKSVFLNIS